MATVRYTTLDGEVVAEKRSGVRRLYQPDPLGSTVGLVDSTQTQTDTFAYWPYGEERSRSGTTATPFRFVGTAGYYRESVSRTYVRARHLDCATGRWLTADPVGSRISPALDRYAYGASAPTVLLDPSGMAPNPNCQPMKGGYKRPPVATDCDPVQYARCVAEMERRYGVVPYDCFMLKVEFGEEVICWPCDKPEKPKPGKTGIWYCACNCPLTAKPGSGCKPLPKQCNNNSVNAFGWGATHQKAKDACRKMAEFAALAMDCGIKHCSYKPNDCYQTRSK